MIEIKERCLCQRMEKSLSNLTNARLATHNLTVKVSAEEAGHTARVCTINESTVSGVRFQLSKELEKSFLASEQFDAKRAMESHAKTRRHQ